MDNNNLASPDFTGDQYAELIAKKTVTRDQIAEFMQIRSKLLTELICKKRISPPAPVGRVQSTYLYNAEQSAAWIKTKPLDLESRPDKSTKARKPPGLDNGLVLSFLTAKPESNEPLTMTDLANKHSKQRLKTTIVHLKERNDYVPPHSALAPSSHSGADHRYCGGQL